MFLENPVNHKEQFGWIEVICGSMFSGKTEELIRRLKRAQFAKQKIEIFKPAIDIRYDDDLVTSHDSNQIPSTPVNRLRSPSLSISPVVLNVRQSLQTPGPKLLTARTLILYPFPLAR